MKLKVYGDRISQPTRVLSSSASILLLLSSFLFPPSPSSNLRIHILVFLYSAVLIFRFFRFLCYLVICLLLLCSYVDSQVVLIWIGENRVNGINFEEIHIDLPKRQQRPPEFREINPMKQVPTIVDGRFKFFESHAILCYLASAFPGVADHWYPADLFTRARINSVLDWHHLNLRRGAFTLILNTVLASTFVWLGGNGKFLPGSSLPSIADLSLVCEIVQLEILEEKDVNRLLGHHKKILQWIEDTRNAMKPHFDEVHKTLFKFKSGLHKQSSGQNYKTESSIKAIYVTVQDMSKFIYEVCRDIFSTHSVGGDTSLDGPSLSLLFFFSSHFNLSITCLIRL
ncbi:hypothetical protein NE237_027653 [Protea cynaroides]|uniref:GST N-terminal domain-containing protein n=1 Tax=Protea cynaroides TaxID=273540 RepID=A0A9Q0JT74_9MAGN|nr:hypothetical protein NE237_027653 [Protea cynaroides]